MDERRMTELRGATMETGERLGDRVEGCLRQTGWRIGRVRAAGIVPGCDWVQLWQICDREV